MKEAWAWSFVHSHASRTAGAMTAEVDSAVLANGHAEPSANGKAKLSAAEKRRLRRKQSKAAKQSERSVAPNVHYWALRALKQLSSEQLIPVFAVTCAAEVRTAWCISLQGGS